MSSSACTTHRGVLFSQDSGPAVSWAVASTEGVVARNGRHKKPLTCMSYIQSGS